MTEIMKQKRIREAAQKVAGVLGVSASEVEAMPLRALMSQLAAATKLVKPSKASQRMARKIQVADELAARANAKAVKS